MPRLNGTSLSSGSYTNLYQAPSGSRATVTVNLCNRSSQPAYIRLALSPSGTTTPSTDDYLEFDALLARGGSIERTGITPANEDIIFVYSNIDDVTALAWGYRD